MNILIIETLYTSGLKLGYKTRRKILLADLVLQRLDQDSYKIIKSRYCQTENIIKKSEQPEYFL